MALAGVGACAVQRPGTLLPDLAFHPPQSRTLLAALVAAGGPVTRDVLLEQLRPQLAPDRALAAPAHDTARLAAQPAVGPRADCGELVTSEGGALPLALREDDQKDAAEFLVLAAALAAEPAGPGAERNGDRLRRAQAAALRSS
jgi:hypothetical protein